MVAVRGRWWLAGLTVAGGAVVIMVALLAPGSTLGQTGATATPSGSAGAPFIVVRTGVSGTGTAGANQTTPAVQATPGPQATSTAQASPGPLAPTRAAAAVAAPAAPVVSAGSAPAPALDNEAAVRMLLPANIRDSERLPVHKWARADMPNAPGGYVVFIATMYPDLPSGNEFLIANYLQWDGVEWVPALPVYAGIQLQGDDVWLAQHLTDITALVSPPEQDYRVFTVGYTAQGVYNPTLDRTETVAQIYDLSLTTAWTRIITLTDIDISNTGYTLKHSEDVDWVFQDIDGDGIAELLATVTDTDEITLTASGTTSATAPAPGVTTSATLETYKWKSGVFTLQSTMPVTDATGAAPAPTPPAATPTRAAPAATPTRTPTAPRVTPATPTPRATPVG